MPDAIIFDIDGTLIDSVDAHAEAWVVAFKQFGYTVGFEEMKQKIGKGGEFVIEDVFSPEEVEAKGEQIHSFRSQYYHDNFLKQVQPLPKVRELFERIREDGLRILLATSAQPESAEHYIELLGVKDLIEGCTTTGDVKKAKPNPDIFETVLAKLDGITADQVIVVGDSPYDAEAAAKAFLQTVGVLTGGFSEEQLKSAGCIAIYKDPADLLAYYTDSPLSPKRAV